MTTPSLDTPNDPAQRVYHIVKLLGQGRPRVSTKQVEAFLWVASYTGATQVDVAAALGVSQSNAQRSLADFMEDGLVERKGVASVNSAYHYQLTRKGKLLMEQVTSYLKEVQHP